MTWFRFNGFFSAPVSRNTPARRGDTIAPHKKAQEASRPSDPPLIFAGPLLIVGGGAVDTDLLRAVAGSTAGIVGADSGADTVLAAGLVPDAVIGDMDSVKTLDALPAHTQVFAIADQYSTDFEKALELTQAPLTIAMGMTGGRFDHTLAALHALTHAAETRRIMLIDERDLALAVSGSIRVVVGEGARVSIYPLGRTVFKRSEGLLYPLDGLDMQQGRKIGTSNTANADEIIIEVAGGKQSPFLLIVEKEKLPVFLR